MRGSQTQKAFLALCLGLPVAVWARHGSVDNESLQRRDPHISFQSDAPSLQRRSPVSSGVGTGKGSGAQQDVGVTPHSERMRAKVEQYYGHHLPTDPRERELSLFHIASKEIAQQPAPRPSERREDANGLAEWKHRLLGQGYNPLDLTDARMHSSSSSLKDLGAGATERVARTRRAEQLVQAAHRQDSVENSPSVHSLSDSEGVDQDANNARGRTRSRDDGSNRNPPGSSTIDATGYQHQGQGLLARVGSHIEHQHTSQQPQAFSQGLIHHEDVQGTSRLHPSGQAQSLFASPFAAPRKDLDSRHNALQREHSLFGSGHHESQREQRHGSYQFDPELLDHHYNKYLEHVRTLNAAARGRMRSDSSLRRQAQQDPELGTSSPRQAQQDPKLGTSSPLKLSDAEERSNEASKSDQPRKKRRLLLKFSTGLGSGSKGAESTDIQPLNNNYVQRGSKIRANQALNNLKLGQSKEFLTQKSKFDAGTSRTYAEDAVPRRKAAGIKVVTTERQDSKPPITQSLSKTLSSKLQSEPGQSAEQPPGASDLGQQLSGLNPAQERPQAQDFEDGRLASNVRYVQRAKKTTGLQMTRVPGGASETAYYPEQKEDKHYATTAPIPVYKHAQHTFSQRGAAQAADRKLLTPNQYSRLVGQPLQGSEGIPKEQKLSTAEPQTAPSQTETTPSKPQVEPVQPQAEPSQPQAAPMEPQRASSQPSDTPALKGLNEGPLDPWTLHGDSWGQRKPGPIEEGRGKGGTKLQLNRLDSGQQARIGLLNGHDFNGPSGLHANSFRLRDLNTLGASGPATGGPQMFSYGNVMMHTGLNLGMPKPSAAGEGKGPTTADQAGSSKQQ